MTEGNGDKTLRKIADAFNDLANVFTDSQSAEAEVKVAPFSHACSLVSPLFGCLGVAFKFAEMDYVAKVHDLAEASKSIQNLQSLIELDVQANTVRKGGSHTRNLLRVKRGLDMVRVLFEQILVTEYVHHLLIYILLCAKGNSLRDPASKAYEQVFAPHHGWAIRKAVSAGMYALPTKEQLLKKLNEDEASAKDHMQSYVTASAPLIQYIDKLFVSRDLGIDW
ncbi:Accelerated cell death 11 [Glycine max]|nr:Accelerated cell death 11 [Glycine max]